MKGMAEELFSKPTLQVSAYVASNSPSVAVPLNSYSKSERKRCEKKIAAMEKALKNWDAAKVAAEAKSSLQRELASEKQYLASMSSKKPKDLYPKGIPIK